MASIHQQLQDDCYHLGKFTLCHLLLLNDSNYPWFILLPDRDNISEIYELTGEDQLLLHKESVYLSQQLAQHFNADKMNIAALGNVVPQLHIHHIVRYKHDVSWPKPVWGAYPAKPYTDTQLRDMKSGLCDVLVNIEWTD